MNDLDVWEKDDTERGLTVAEMEAKLGGPNLYQLLMLSALNDKTNWSGALVPMFQGCTKLRALRRRRARNKVAKRSRKVNRGN